jgi:YD repeat-containing protein
MSAATNRRVGLVVLLAVVVAGSAGAQQPPELERGFKPELVYQFNGLDSVNLFNGNLNMSVPLGGTYPVGGGLSYSFVLRYSGNVWLGREDCTYGRQEDTVTRCAFRYIPHLENAGLGWRLSFGELKPPLLGPEWGDSDMTKWRYVSPDGGEHFFHPTLHGCTAGSASCELEVSGVLYTRDGTYLRMKDDGAAAKIIEFPDGQRHRFQNDGTDAEPRWRLKRMYTGPRPGSTTPENRVELEYDDVAKTCAVTDSASARRHVIYFRSHPALTTYQVVDRIELASFAGPATYQFTYYDGPLARPCGTLSPTSIPVSLLTGLTLPGGERYEFGYNQPTDNLCTSHAQSGTLSKAVLPTLGRVQWTYRTNSLTTGSNGAPQAVHERRVFDASNKEIERRIYTQTATDNVLEPPAAKTTVTNYVQNTLGAWEVDSKTVSYFNLAPDDDVTPRAVFGLPYAPLEATTTAPNPDGSDKQRYLSMEFFDCRSDGSCSLERASYVKHEMDYAPACSNGAPCLRHRNTRVSTESTVYVTDGSRAAYTDYSSFDGLGHYRQANTGLIINNSGNPLNEREVFTGYNLNVRGFDGTTWSGSSVGTYSATATGFSGFTMLSASDPWILNTYTSTYAREGGVTAEVRTCFDPRTGFLHRKRVRSGTTANDMLSVFTPHASGYIEREEYYGGDDPDQALGSVLQNLCTMALPSASRYRIDHTYQAGSLANSKYVNPSTGLGVGFSSVDLTIEPRTGLPSESRDTAGIATKYAYDSQGRLTSTTPQAWTPSPVTEAETTYRYFPAVGANAPARVEMKKQDVESIWFFDALGRVRREKRRMPDSSWSVRDTERNTLGQVTSVSELVQLPAGVSELDFVPAQKTRYSDFDAFGRAGTVTGPDGATSTVTYTGVRQVVRTTHGIATNTGAGTSVSVTEEFDRYGRLTRVRENSSGSDWVETTYGYDASDRLRSVSMTSPAGVTQSRTFVYDGRGLLVSETHPESGPTSYEYDARGHVTKRVTPKATLTFEYDAAERLVKVWDDGLLVKELVYDPQLAPGRLGQAIRHNRLEVGDVQVKETYAYTGAGGRLSSKKTSITVDATAGPTFEDGYTYDTLGMLTSLKYPSCSGCGVTPPSRTVGMEYSAGTLKKVTGYGSVDYWPNGMLKSVHHEGLPNTARPVDEQLMDTTTGMPRPTMITFKNFCADFRIQTHPVARTVRKDQQAGLTVVVPGAQTYQWYAGEGESGLISGATGATLTIPATVTTTYWVRASNGACTVDSRPALLTVEGTCGNPPTASIFGTTTVSSGTTTDITVTLTGTAPWILTWSDGVIESNVQASPHSRAVTPPATTEYVLTTVKDANGCSGTSSGSAVITVTNPSSCTRPNATISAHPSIDAYSEENEASVPATAGASYVWSISGGDAVITGGQGTPTMTYSAPMCSGTFALTATVATSCGTATGTKLVTILAATADLDARSITVDSFGNAQLTADLTGTPPWDVTWFDGLQEIKKTYSASPAKLNVKPAVNTDYRITAVTSGPQACPGTVFDEVAHVIVPCDVPNATLNVPSTSMRSSTMGSASVTSTTPGVTYQWSITNGTIFTGADSSSVTYRAGCNAGPAQLTVVVRASCGATETRTASINVTPAAATVDGSSQIVQGSSATISAAIDGVGPWSVTWSDGVVQNNVTTSPATRSVSPDVTTTYSVTAVSDAYGCAGTASGSWVVTVAPPAPSAITAVATDADRVLVQWAFSGNADEFRIERFDRVSGSPAEYRLIGTVTGTARSFLNVSIPAATAYLYRVRAVKAGVASAASQPDLATTIVFADDPIVSTRTIVTANQILQLRSAVDAVRALALLTAGTYTTKAEPRQWITRAAIEDLRAALDPARQALSLPAVSYSERPLEVHTLIRGAYWTELRGGVK